MNDLPWKKSQPTKAMREGLAAAGFEPMVQSELYGMSVIFNELLGKLVEGNTSKPAIILFKKIPHSLLYVASSVLCAARK